jgi:hypothetical protein
VILSLSLSLSLHNREAMAAIERASDVHTTLNATKGMATKLVKGIPIEKVYTNLHRTAHDTALAFNHLEPKLGDRIVNLACPGVPFGLRGTVVTIHQATQYVEVSLSLSLTLSLCHAIFHLCNLSVCLSVLLFTNR